MFGSRRDENGNWWLCEKRGRFIFHPFADHQDIIISFPNKGVADECASALNNFWDLYEKERQDTRGWKLQTKFMEILRRYDALTEEEYRRLVQDE